MVRFSCNTGHERWLFWLEVTEGTAVQLEVAVSLLEATQELKAFVRLLPSWTSEVAVTTFQSKWRL